MSLIKRVWNWATSELLLFGFLRSLFQVLTMNFLPPAPVPKPASPLAALPLRLRRRRRTGQRKARLRHHLHPTPLHDLHTLVSFFPRRPRLLARGDSRPRSRSRSHGSPQLPRAVHPTGARVDAVWTFRRVGHSVRATSGACHYQRSRSTIPAFHPRVFVLVASG